MKKFFIVIALVVMSLVAIAQTNQLVWSNGRLIYGTSIESIDSLTYGEMDELDTLHLLLPRTLIKVVHDTVYVHDTIYVECSGDVETSGQENGYAYVDLGLSVKWATCNVGATTPEDFGDFFAWGEVETKKYYDWSTYKYCEGSYVTLTKYCNNNEYGNNDFTDNKIILDPEDDVAHVSWGGAWRMPTRLEQDELRNNCTWIWTTQNGKKGYKVTGPNGNSIFLPAAGCMSEGSHTGGGSYGCYWSSSLWTDNPRDAYSVYNSSFSVDNRDDGLSVRPVCQ